MLHITPFTQGDRATLGQRAATLLVSGESIPNPLAMMVLATADPDARILCRDLMHERIIIPLAEWLGGEGAMERSARLNMLWIGFMTARTILPLQPLHGEDEQQTLRWLEVTTQAIADEG